MEKFTADRIVTINVDVQNDFLPGGALAVKNGDQVINPLNSLNEFTRMNNGLVVATGDQHPTTTPHFDAWPVHCVAGTDGAALARNLDIRRSDIIVDKGMGQTDGYSAFEGIAQDGRTLESIITPVGRERVAAVFGGLATDYCVLNSVLDGLRVNQGKGELQIFVVNDAVKAVNIEPNDGRKALAQMDKAGAHLVNTLAILREDAFRLAK
jgi:nicotinamidase/pyrazinamidase